MAAEAVEFGTGLLRTTVRRTVHGYRWSRAPGPDAPSPFAAVSPGTAALLAGLPAVPGTGRAAATGWLLGEEDGRGHRHYSARSPLSAARLLLPGDRRADGAPPTALVDAVTGLGALLARLHRTPLPPGTPPPAPSRALRRLHAWLTDDSPVPGAELLRDALGARRHSTLVRGCSAALAPGDDGVLCHGAPGLGSLLPGGPGGAAAVFIGEDLCLAPPATDLGWLVGELIGLRWSLGAGAPEAWQRLVDAAAAGYGATAEVSDSFWPALRVAARVHDTVAYRPRPPDAVIPRFAPLLRGLLDASGLHTSDRFPGLDPGPGPGRGRGPRGR
ncbi:phosphotransferase [Kitasatospora sp. NPDC002965]|uniref:phosphotransferase n=1 Tax=Kitasatospora sp. NPDC002965 TaxID=3154775 RepID=UPI0033A818E7